MALHLGARHSGDPLRSGRSGVHGLLGTADQSNNDGKFRWPGIAEAGTWVPTTKKSAMKTAAKAMNLPQWPPIKVSSTSTKPDSGLPPDGAKSGRNRCSSDQAPRHVPSCFAWWRANANGPYMAVAKCQHHAVTASLMGTAPPARSFWRWATCRRSNWSTSAAPLQSAARPSAQGINPLGHATSPSNPGGPPRWRATPRIRRTNRAVGTPERIVQPSNQLLSRGSQKTETLAAPGNLVNYGRAISQPVL